MVYPKNIEEKLGFNEIRAMLKEHCLSTLGKGRVDEMVFMTDEPLIAQCMEQIREFVRIMDGGDDFPLVYFFDVREAVSRLRLVGTYLDEDELFSLKCSLDTIGRIVTFLNRTETDDDSEATSAFPALKKLTEGIVVFPQIVNRIDAILDKFGKIRDDASSELLRI